MKTVFLHAGLEKTGTTYVQEVLYKNRALLKKQGVIYPCSGVVDNQHYWLAKALGFHYQKGNINSVKESEVIQSIQAQIDSRRQGDLLLSSEHFDFNVNDESLHKLKSLFSGYDIKVILTFRNQLDYAQSLYVENIKWGGILPFEKFYLWCEGRRRFDYLNKYNLWKSCGFNVSVIDYDGEKNNLMGKFFEAIDCELNDKFIINSSARNASEGIDFVEFVRQYNSGINKELRRNNYFFLRETLERINPDLLLKRGWPIPESLKESVRQKNLDNTLLKKELGLDEEVNFLGGDLLEKYSHKRHLTPPNTKNIIDALFSEDRRKTESFAAMFIRWGALCCKSISSKLFGVMRR